MYIMAQNTQMTRVQRVQWLKELVTNTYLKKVPESLTHLCDLVVKEHEFEILEVFPDIANHNDNSYTPKQDPSRTEITKGAFVRMKLPRGFWKKLQGLMQG